MSTAPPGPLPGLQQTISGTSTAEGSQNLTGVVYGNVTFGSTASSSAQISFPKPTSTVPFRRDPDFVDRGDFLARIDERCGQPAGRAALVGLGGVGKSQLAIEYAHRLRDRSPETWVFWVLASNASRVEEAYKEIADRLKLLGPDESNVATNTISLVVRWLSDEHNGRWLMIVDNVDELDTLSTGLRSSERTTSLSNMLPQSRNGAVLVTSRNANVARQIVGRDKDVLRVSQMNQHEATELFLKKLVEPPDGNETDLLAALEYFPLAITQAAAYINQQPGVSVSGYLRKLQATESKTSVFERTFPDIRRPAEANSSVLRTWQISFERIKSKHPGAADLLAFMSFFNNQDIPNFMLPYYKYHHYKYHEVQESKTTPDRTSRRFRNRLSMAKLLPRFSKRPAKTQEESTSSAGAKPARADDELEEQIAALHNFSLISAKSKDDQSEMHALVQFATRVWLRSIEQEDEWWTRFVGAMASAFPYPKYENWPTCRALLPHIPSVAEKRPTNSEQAGVWANLLCNAAKYSWEQGLFSQAQALLRTSLEQCEILFGIANEHSLRTLTLLSIISGEAGKVREGEEMARRVLAQRVEMLGNHHPHTLVSMNNIAVLLERQERYREADEMHRQVLAKRMEKLGEDHPDTLSSINNLASLLRVQERYEEAEEMLRQALAQRVKTLGADHPNTSRTTNNIAVLLDRQGKHEEAEEMYRQALAQLAKELGEDHLDTLRTTNNIAISLEHQGKHEEAEEMLRQVLARRVEKLGPDQRDTLSSMNNLALVLSTLRRFEEAEELFRRSLGRREERLGKDHPDTLDSTEGLADLLSKLGRYDEAKLLYERACAGYKAQLGDSHRTTVNCTQDYHDMLSKMQDLGSQEPCGDSKIGAAQEVAN